MTGTPPSIPIDVLHLICQELRTDSASPTGLGDLCSFALASRATAAIARGYIFYSLVLASGRKSADVRLSILQDDHSLCSLIKEIHIDEYRTWTRRDDSSSRSEADERIFTKLRAVADQSNEKLNPRIIVWNAMTVIGQNSHQSLTETFPPSKLRIHLQSYEGDNILYSPYLESIVAPAIHLY